MPQHSIPHTNSSIIRLPDLVVNAGISILENISISTQSYSFLIRTVFLFGDFFLAEV